MIGGGRVLAVIPARGGSKGVPRKNIRDLAGKPLIAWTIEAGRQSRYIDRMILSSDDAEIIAVARQWGCEAPFVRPAELATDQASGTAPVLHALQQLPDFDYVVLLQPTSPLRTAEDIDACIEACAAPGTPAVVSVVAVDKPPQWMYCLDSAHRLAPVLASRGSASRRQDLETVYALNGAIYVAKVNWFLEHQTFVTHETRGYPMPKERSIDIDTELDLQLAHFLIQLQNRSAVRQMDMESSENLSRTPLSGV